MTDRSNNAADPTYLKFPVIVGIVDTGTSQTMVLLIPGPLPQ
jgi:hypothetical protein